MARITTCWLIPVAALGIFLLLGLTPHTARAARPDVTFEGAVHVGGTLRLTLSADHSGITSFSLKDVPFVSHGGCGLYSVSPSAYFIPPLAIVDKSFSVDVHYGDAHHPNPYTFRGTVTSESRIEGTVQQGSSLGCSHPSDDLHWRVDGPVAALQHTEDVRFVGALGGGQITAITNQARSQLTSVRLQGVRLPCVADLTLDIDAQFDPPFELRSPGNYFFGVMPTFFGGAQWPSGIGLDATVPRADIMGGYIVGGDGSCDRASRTLIWTATLLADASVIPAPTTPSVLPSSGRAQDARGPYAWLYALSIVGTLLFVLGIRLRRS